METVCIFLARVCHQVLQTEVLRPCRGAFVVRDLPIPKTQISANPANRVAVFQHSSVRMHSNKHYTPLGKEE